MQLFYSKEIEKLQTLNKEESQHCQKVLRKKKMTIYSLQMVRNFMNVRLKKK